MNTSLIVWWSILWRNSAMLIVWTLILAVINSELDTVNGRAALAVLQVIGMFVISFMATHWSLRKHYDHFD